MVLFCLVVRVAVDLNVLWVGGFEGLIGKALLYRMLCMIFNSCRYSSSCKL